MDTTTRTRIGQALKRMYDGLPGDAMPDRLQTLIDELERAVDAVEDRDPPSEARRTW